MRVNTEALKCTRKIISYILDKDRITSRTSFFRKKRKIRLGHNGSHIRKYLGILFRILLLVPLGRPYEHASEIILSG